MRQYYWSGDGERKSLDVELRAAGSYDTDAVSDETGLKCEDESLTEQSSKDEADINFLMKRYVATGELPEFKTPQYLDISELPDYRQMRQMLVDARSAFMELPWQLRAEFNNDAAEFADAFSNPDMLGKLQRLGLVKEKDDGDSESEGAAGDPGGRGLGAADAQRSGEPRGSSGESGGADSRGTRVGESGDSTAGKPPGGAR